MKQFRFLLLPLLVSYLPLATMAQSSSRAIDSLLVVLKTAKEDTGKVNALNELAYQLVLVSMTDSVIQLRVLKQADGVRYEIADNGVGREKAEEMKSAYRKEHKSRGMELLTKRFKLLNEEYKSEIHTEITDLMKDGEAAGTRVTIAVPRIMAKEIKLMAS